MKCILIDDEPLAREGLSQMLTAVPSLEILDVFSNAIDANHFLKSNSVDLIFLDIEMAALNGLDFAKSLINKPLIIFITAYPQYALESFEVDAIDYLVKPVRMERLLKAVNKAENFLSLIQKSNTTEEYGIEADYIFLKTDKRFIKIFFNDILYVEGLKDYVFLYTDNKKILAPLNIKNIYSKLPSKSFARISKSYIVNVSQITSFDTNAVYIKDEEIPIGNNFKDDFFENYVQDKIIKR